MAGTDTPSNAPLALITGASSGMGREIARRLARRGYRTLLVARREALLREASEELSRFAPSVGLSLDLNDPAAIEAAIPAALAEHGDPEVLINCAGHGLYRLAKDQADAEVRTLMQVHYFAAFALIRLTLPAMLQRRKGHVINIASMSTKIGPWGHAGYAAAKAALVSLTQSLAAEHQVDGVRFSYVNPGIVRTDYFASPAVAGLFGRQQRRAIEPGRVADATVRLLDHPRLEICVPGHYRALDWLKAISPGLAHRIVASESRPPPDAVLSQEGGG